MPPQIICRQVELPFPRHKVLAPSGTPVIHLYIYPPGQILSCLLCNIYNLFLLMEAFTEVPHCCPKMCFPYPQPVSYLGQSNLNMVRCISLSYDSPLACRSTAETSSSVVVLRLLSVGVEVVAPLNPKYIGTEPPPIYGGYTATQLLVW